MKTYFRGLLTGLIIGASSILFMGSKFGGFKSINDVYDLMVTVQEDLEYIKKWGIECNGGSVECD